MALRMAPRHRAPVRMRPQPRWLNAAAKTCGITRNAVAVEGVAFDAAVYATDDIVSTYFSRFGQWEPQVWSWLGPYCDESCTFVDIGANIGMVSMMAAARGREVVAYEPFSTNRNLFETTLCMNKVVGNRVTLNPYGLSNKAEVCVLKSPRDNFGDITIDCDQGKRSKTIVKDLYRRKGYEIVGTAGFNRLDEEKTLFNRSKVVKMDVEGHELQVLAGGELFFTMGKPPTAVIIEYVLFLDANRKTLWQVMADYGYREQQRDSSNVMFVRTRADETQKA